MTEIVDPPNPTPATPEPPTKRRRPWLRWLIPAVALLVGAGIGAAGAGADPTASSEYRALEERLAEVREERDEAEQRAADSSREVSTASEEAAAEARQQAEEDVAARAAELDEREADVAAREEALTAAEQEPDPEPEVAPEPEPEPAPDLTTGQENAVGAAANYLEFSAFSRTGLIQQLEYEGYSTADATSAVDSLGTDWREQAVKSAENYLSFSSFSRSGLVDQLVFEGFTPEQAEYGASQTYSG
jgi:colicin import membrane protein